MALWNFKDSFSSTDYVMPYVTGIDGNGGKIVVAANDNIYIYVKDFTTSLWSLDQTISTLNGLSFNTKSNGVEVFQSLKFNYDGDFLYVADADYLYYFKYESGSFVEKGHFSINANSWYTNVYPGNLAVSRTGDKLFVISHSFSIQYLNYYTWNVNTETYDFIDQIDPVYPSSSKIVKLAGGVTGTTITPTPITPPTTPTTPTTPPTTPTAPTPPPTPSPPSPPDLVYDSSGFGVSIDCSRDGNIIFVGDPYHGFRSYASVYKGIVFKFIISDNVLVQDDVINNNAYYSSYFGYSLAVSEKGDDVLIGSPFGAYDTNTGVPKDSEYISGSAYLYNIDPTYGPTLTQRFGLDSTLNIDNFGIKVAMNYDSAWLSISCPRADVSSDAGVYTYLHNGTSHALQDQLQYSGRYFGYDLAISKYLGSTMIIGLAFTDTQDAELIIYETAFGVARHETSTSLSPRPLTNTTDSRTNYEKQQSTDSRTNYEKQHSTDSRTNYEKQQSTDSRTNYEKQHSTDTRTNYEKQQSVDTRTNYEKQQSVDTRTNYEKQHSTDTKTNYEKQHSVDTRTNYEKQHSTDTRTNYEKQQSVDTRTNYEKQHSTDTKTSQVQIHDVSQETEAVLAVRRGKAHATNLRKYLLISKQHDAKAHLYEQFSAEITSLTYLKSTFDVSQNINALSSLTSSLETNTGFYLKSTSEISSNADAITYLTTSSQTDTQSTTIKYFDQSHLTDIYLKQTNALAHDLNSLLKSTPSLINEVSLLKLKTADLSHGINSTGIKSSSVISTTGNFLSLTTQKDFATESLLVKTFKLAYFTDSFAKATITADHSLDLLKKSTIYLNYESNTLKKSSFDYSSDTESYLLQAIDNTHLTISFAKARFDLSTIADAYLRSSYFLGHGTNKLLKATESSSHSTDTIKLSQSAKTHDTNAYKLAETILPHDTNTISYLRSDTTHEATLYSYYQNQLSQNINAFSIKSTSSSYAITGSLNNISSLLHLTDIGIIGQRSVNQNIAGASYYFQQLSQEAQSNLRATFSKISQVNSLVLDTASLSHELSSRLLLSSDINHYASSLSRASYDIGFSNDSLLMDTVATSHDAIAFNISTASLSHSADSYWFSVNSISLDTDIFLKSANAVAHDAITITFDAGVLVNHSTPAVIGTFGLSVSTDTKNVFASDLTIDTDSRLSLTSGKTFQTNLLSLGNFAYSQSVRSLVKSSTYLDQTVTGLNFIRVFNPVLTDSYLKATFTRSHISGGVTYYRSAVDLSSDSSLFYFLSLGQLTSSIFYSRSALQFLTDSLVIDSTSLSFSADMSLSDLSRVVQSSNAFKKANFALDFSSDLFKYVRLTASVSSDVFVFRANDLSVSTLPLLIGSLSADHATDISAGSPVLVHSATGVYTSIVTGSAISSFSFSSQSSADFDVPLANKKSRDFIVTNRKILIAANWGNLDIADRQENVEVVLTPAIAVSAPVVEMQPFSALSLPAEQPVLEAPVVKAPVKTKAFSATQNPFRRQANRESFINKPTEDNFSRISISSSGVQPNSVSPTVIALPNKSRRLSNGGMPSR